jgi:DNA-binding NtrC family response regulator
MNPSDAPKSQVRILVVEDDPKLLQSVTALLEREGHQVSAIEDVESFPLAHLPYAEAKRVAMRSFERRYLSTLLEKSGNNVSSAARAAGVDRSNFRRLLKQYDVMRDTGAKRDGAEVEAEAEASLPPSNVTELRSAS